MRIAYYEAEYFDAVKTLFLSHYNKDGYGCRFSEEKADAYLKELFETPRFMGFLLLDSQDRLIGFSFCHERTWWENDELYINEFIVSEEHQKKGYGSKLLTFMQKHAKEREMAGITLITNSIPLAKFYQKNKFSDHEIYFMYRGA